MEQKIVNQVQLHLINIKLIKTINGFQFKVRVNGLYLITKVSHSLQGNSLITNFEGVRVPVFTFPIPNNFIATLSKNVYSNYQTNVAPKYAPNPKYYNGLDSNKKNNISLILKNLKNTLSKFNNILIL